MRTFSLSPSLSRISSIETSQQKRGGCKVAFLKFIWHFDFPFLGHQGKLYSLGGAMSRNILGPQGPSRTPIKPLWVAWAFKNHWKILWPPMDSLERRTPPTNALGLHGSLNVSLDSQGRPGNPEGLLQSTKALRKPRSSQVLSLPQKGVKNHLPGAPCMVCVQFSIQVSIRF